jgi:hypothetical protein
MNENIPFTLSLPQVVQQKLGSINPTSAKKPIKASLSKTQPIEISTVSSEEESDSNNSNNDSNEDGESTSEAITSVDETVMVTKKNKKVTSSKPRNTNIKIPVYKTMKKDTKGVNQNPVESRNIVPCLLGDMVVIRECVSYPDNKVLFNIICLFLFY